MLEVHDLSIDLEHRALLRNASFTIPPRTIVGLCGPSGSGKTTLALALLRLLPEPRYRVRGSILLNGRDLQSCSEPQLQPIRGAVISMVFQDPLQSLNPVLRVRTQIAEAARAHSKPPDIARRLAAVDLPDPHIADAWPHQLSGGERQRVSLAIALAADPQLVIADEPFTALDAPRTIDLARLFRRLSISMLLISHHAGVLAKLADHTLTLRDAHLHA